MTVLEVTHPEDRAGILERFREGRQSRQQTVQAEKRYLRRDDSVIWLLLTMTLPVDSAGDPVCSSLR